jgi:hypothetical protein
MRKGAIAAAGLAGLTAGLMLVSGCSIRESICRSGEYPVKAVDSTTGGACVTKGEDPPAGYVRYPTGKVPKYVDDEWDRYWSTHKLDAQGTEVAA